MDFLRIACIVVLITTSLIAIPLVLMHKGRGGGLSDMFGGGMSSGAGSSGVAARNLDRITVSTTVIWAISIVLLGLIQRVSG